jgi:hypothetical protein
MNRTRKKNKWRNADTAICAVFVSVGPYDFIDAILFEDLTAQHH